MNFHADDDFPVAGGAGNEAFRIGLAGIDDAVMARFKPCTPAAIAAVVAWLAERDPEPDWEPHHILRGPAIARALGLLKSPSLLE